MKKILIVLVFGLFTLCSFSTAASLVDDAVARAYAKNLTMYYDTKAFNPNNHIRRDDAAKFFVNFAKLVGKTEYVVNANQCQFPDLNEAWSDLRGFVVESCRLGIFKGNNGKFNPKGNLTNAQAVAVLMRIIDGYQLESGLSHWSDIYYKRANVLGILSNVSMNDKNTVSTRGSVIIMMYDARNISSDYGVSPKSTTTKTSQTSNTNVNNAAMTNMLEGIFNTSATRATCLDTSVLAACVLGNIGCPAICAEKICEEPRIQKTCISNSENCLAICKGSDIILPSNTYSRTLGNRGTCSKTCDGGTQTRIVQCKSSDGNIVNDNYCSGTKPTTSQSCNTHVCGTTPLYVTHTANGNIITLKWNVIQGPERLDIHVFNESQEKRVRAGDAKMADKRFDYTVSWWGKHLFKLIPSDGSQETLYEVYIYSIQTSRYPGCNTDDIKIGNHTIAACNVGSSKAGISSTSYGEDYTYNEAKNICANGYHLPSKEERWAIIDIWNASSNHVGDYIILPYSFITEEGIFIPAGAPFIADRSNGDLLKFQNDHRLPLDGDRGVYWSSSIDGFDGNYYNSILSFSLSGLSFFGFEDDGYILAVRCFKD